MAGSWQGHAPSTALRGAAEAEGGQGAREAGWE